MDKIIERLQQLLFDTPDDNGGGTGDLGDLEVLGAEDKVDDVEDPDPEDKDDKEEDPDKEDKTDEEEDEDEDKEDEDKEDEDDEDEEDKEVVNAISSYHEVKTKYPEFFKEFPDVKNALFREGKYAELFASPDEAKDASDKAATLDVIEKEILVDGDPTNLLNTVAKENKDAFQKLAFNILPYLQKNDKDLYLEVAALPIKQLLRAAYREGKGNETNLGKAAAYIHQFFFNNTNVDEAIKAESGGGTGDDKETPKEKALRERLEKLEGNKAQEFGQSADTSYVNKMTSYVMDGLNKDDRLTDYTKTKLVEDILLDIKKQLSDDKKYVRQIQSIQQEAKASGFTNNDLKSRLINTALVRAKSLVPEVRKRLVAEAIKSTSKKRDKVTNIDDKKRDVTSHRSERKPNDRNSSKPMTDMDILRS